MLLRRVLGNYLSSQEAPSLPSLTATPSAERLSRILSLVVQSLLDLAVARMSRIICIRPSTRSALSEEDSSRRPMMSKR